MEFLRSKIFFCCFLVWLLGACSAVGLQLDLEDDFSYDEESPNGPSNWGEIRPEWSTCSTGKMQSPIDIVDDRVILAPELGSLRRYYKSSNATLVNRGHDMLLEWVNGGGYIDIDGTKYYLRQCHWHSPSEHLINGRRFDLEIHLVHQSIDGNVAVIGFVYEIGPPDPFLSGIGRYIKELVHTVNEARAIGYVDPNWINTGKGEYYRYMGSLTTPPCSETVIWTLMGEVKTTSRQQVELIRRALHGYPKTNARPVQPLNNRLIKLYRRKPRVPLDDIPQYVLSSLDKIL